MTTEAQMIRQKAGEFKKFIDLCDKDLTSILPKGVNLERLKEVFILTCKHTPKLLTECTQASLMKAIFTCATLGLEPDPYMGQVYILPYGKAAQVIPGYKGLAKLVRNSGEVSSIYSGAVRENDDFDYALGSDPFVKHKPLLRGERGEIIFFYSCATLRDGSKHIEIMTVDEVNTIRDNSSAVKSGRQTPWTDKGGIFYEEMGKKTVFRRAVKMLPISTSKELSTAIAIDNAEYEGRQVALDKETGEVIDILPDEEETSPPTMESKGLDLFNESANEKEAS